MRLIDADKLESGELVIPTLYGGYEYVEVFYKDDVDNAPTVDAVEVVRCKDCKHRERYECNHIMLGNTKCGVTDDWFCADGERREDGKRDNS